MNGSPTPEPRRRSARVDALRNDTAILQAAARLLAHNPTATIQQIADQAGVVRLTVYRRYRNRDALRTAVFETAAAETHLAVDAALTRNLDTMTTLRLLIVEMANIARRYPLIVVSADLKPLPGQSRRPAPPPLTRALHTSVFDLVVRGQHDGTLRSDLPAELFPLAVTGTLNNAVRFATALGLDQDRLGDYVADLILTGFSPHNQTSDRPQPPATPTRLR